MVSDFYNNHFLKLSSTSFFNFNHYDYSVLVYLFQLILFYLHWPILHDMCLIFYVSADGFGGIIHSTIIYKKKIRKKITSSILVFCWLNSLNRKVFLQCNEFKSINLKHLSKCELPGDLTNPFLSILHFQETKK